MTSGVGVAKECNEMWQEFHKAKKGSKQKYRVIAFRLADDYKSIIPDDEPWQMEKVSGADPLEETDACRKAINELLSHGSEESLRRPRWIIVYYEFKIPSEDRLTGKEIMIKWCPDGAKVKARMCFSSSTKGLTDALNDFSVTQVQADALEEVDEIKDRLEKQTLK